MRETGDGTRATRINDAAFVPQYFLAALVGWDAARHPALDARARRGWQFLAGACLTLGLSNAFYLLSWDFYPWLDPTGWIGYLLPILWYPIALAALVHFLDAPRTGLERSKFWLDAATVFFAGCLLLFYAFIRTPGQSSTETPQSTFFTLIYPAADAAMTFMAVAAFLRPARGLSHVSLGVIIVALALGFLSDLGYGRAQLANTYRGGDWYEVLYLTGALLFLLAAQQQREEPVAPDATPAPASGGSSMLPYLAVGAAVLILLAELGEGWNTTMGGLVVGAVTLTALVVGRQVVSLRETEAIAARQRAQDVRFRSLVQHASDLITVVSADGAILYQSEATARVLARSAESLEGTPLAALAHPEDAPRVTAALAMAPVEGARHLRWRAARPDGTWRDLESSLTDLTADAAVAGVVLNTRDVTEQLALHDQLRHAQKMEAVGLLASGIAHDFNNILAAIHTSAELIGMVGDNPDARAHDLQQIERAVERAGTLTRQLLAFSRREVVQPQRLDLRGVVSAMEPMLRRLVTREIRLVLDLPAAAVPIEADPSQVEQVLLNLALNARDAMPNGGTLTLRVGRRFLEERPDQLAGEYGLLAVADTGVGIAESVRPRIFEPFFTTKPRGQGSGLGLSTAYAIVTRAGGVLDVQSAPGAGSVFEAFFPISALAPDAPAETASLAPVRRGRRESVLVVDDEPVIRRAVERYLASVGYRVHTAASGEEALARFAAPNVRIDLLLTDMVMPGLGGRELIERATASQPSLRVLCMSGYTEDEALRGAVQRGRPIFIQKPFRLEALGSLVRAALDGPAVAESGAGDATAAAATAGAATVAAPGTR